MKTLTLALYVVPVTNIRYGNKVICGKKLKKEAPVYQMGSCMHVVSVTSGMFLAYFLKASDVAVMASLAKKIAENLALNCLNCLKLT